MTKSIVTLTENAIQHIRKILQKPTLDKRVQVVSVGDNSSASQKISQKPSVSVGDNSSASQKISQKPSVSVGDNPPAFRLSVKQTGCSGYMYQPEVVTSKKENDIAIPIADFIVYIDPACVPLIQGTKIDYVKKSLGQSQLEFNNPNADSLCGCGESFNLKQDPKHARSEAE